MTSAPNSRLASLDALRGIAVAAMIVVNNPGNWTAVFPPLSHAAWHGCTPADLVFPLFIFVMGMAMPLAFARRPASFYRHIGSRAAGLVALGLLLNLVHAWPDVAHLRVPGVLQRIGLTYLIAALIVHHVRPARRLAIAALLLLVHWALLALVPVGGQPAGVLTATDNLAGYVDKAVFGAHTLTATGDPEGVLGLVSSVATALVGAVAGAWVSASSTPRARLGGIVTGGAIALLVGLTWSYALPLNKTLWTGSYAVLASGLAALMFAVCHVLVDVRGRLPTEARGATTGSPWWARPFVWLGASALTIYFLSELVGGLLERPWIQNADHMVSIKDRIFWSWLAPMVGDAGGTWSSLLFALVYTVFWIAVAGCLAITRHRIVATKNTKITKITN